MTKEETVKNLAIEANELDWMYSQAANIKPTLERFDNAISGALPSGERNFYDPKCFEFNFDLEKGLRTIRNRLIYFIKHQVTQKTPNIPIDMKKLIEDYEDKAGETFSATRVIDMLYENFIIQGRSLALKDIMDKARYLIRHESEGTKEEQIKEVVSNATLKLQVRIDQFLTKPQLDYRCRENIQALDKFLNIILDNQPPESAQPLGIWNAISKNGEAIGLYTPQDLRDISKFQIFKNGKMLLTFKVPGNAHMIAAALL
jgi:hypothetical protein